MTTVTILYIALAALAVSLGFSIYYNVKFGLALLRVQDTIQESLEIIEEKYQSLSEILTVPLFYDSPQIKRAVEDLKACRDSILYVAEQFAVIDDSIRDKDQGSELDDN